MWKTFLTTMIFSESSSVSVSSHPSLAGSLWIDRTLGRKELPAMSEIYPQDRWLEIYKWFQQYHIARAAHIKSHQEGRGDSTLSMEGCFFEAGRVLFEMMGALPMPTEEECRPLVREARAISNKPEPRKGFVYLMKNMRNGFFKIGFSRNPQYREQTLQAEEPQIETILTFEGTIADEEALHEQFAPYRIRGEWFRLTSRDVEMISESRKK
jgi:hypothetical protein